MTPPEVSHPQIGGGQLSRDGAGISRDGGRGFDDAPRGGAGISGDDDMWSKYPKTTKRHEDTY